jgi:hypothetical protein
MYMISCRNMNIITMCLLLLLLALVVCFDFTVCLDLNTFHDMISWFIYLFSQYVLIWKRFMIWFLDLFISLVSMSWSEYVSWYDFLIHLSLQSVCLDLNTFHDMISWFIDLFSQYKSNTTNVELNVVLNV